MKAARRDRYGPPEVVEVREVERPEPKDGEVLVRVRAASVNRADLDGLYPRWTFVRLFGGLRTPKERAVGTDVAGVVEAVGAGVTRFEPGDAVMGDLFAFGAGGFAEYACAPERAFAPIPVGMPFDEAATLPHSAVLALQALRLRDGRTIRPGHRVLVVGASGNVGPFAVQIARSMGAEVTGVARGDKLDFVLGLGADHAIDYRTEDYTRPAEGYDWIVDVEARRSVRRWRRALRPGGAYVTLGGSVRAMLAAALLGKLLARGDDRWLGVLMWWKPFKAEDVETLRRLIADGKLRPAIDRRFPLSQVVEALRHVDDGHARGKVVVIP